MVYIINMLNRIELKEKVKKSLLKNRIVTLLGPRQVGKTTLARIFVSSDSPNYFDLEDPVSNARLEEPMTTLRSLSGLVVIDEIQRRPELFPILRVLADRDPLPARFLILGSAAPSLIKNASESLAGRQEVILISGFTMNEVEDTDHDTLWRRGSFPLSFLAASEEDSFVWRRNFIQTLIERDLPMLGVSASSPLMTRFWTMLAHLHGQEWSAADPARTLGIGETTVRRYLDLLTGLFMIRQLQPWHANLKKRQIKAPKIYFQDSGLLHQLLGIRTAEDLLKHPRRGASWEGFAIEQVLLASQPDQAYFWGTHNGAQLDLLLIKGGKKVGVECKHVDAPKLTSSMRIALDDLDLESLTVIYPGEKRYSITDRVEAVPLKDFIRKPELRRSPS